MSRIISFFEAICYIVIGAALLLFVAPVEFTKEVMKNHQKS